MKRVALVLVGVAAVLLVAWFVGPGPEPGESDPSTPGAAATERTPRRAADGPGRPGDRSSRLPTRTGDAGDGAGGVLPPGPRATDGPAPLLGADTASPSTGTVWPTSMEGIRGAVTESIPTIRDECYAPWLSVEPELEGVLKVAFSIVERDGVGVVSAPAVVDPPSPPDPVIDHRFFEACVLNVMANLEFDAPPEPIAVTYPFVFTTEG